MITTIPALVNQCHINVINCYKYGIPKLFIEEIIKSGYLEAQIIYYLRGTKCLISTVPAEYRHSEFCKRHNILISLYGKELNNIPNCLTELTFIDADIVMAICVNTVLRKLDMKVISRDNFLGELKVSNTKTKYLDITVDNVYQIIINPKTALGAMASVEEKIKKEGAANHG